MQNLKISAIILILLLTFPLILGVAHAEPAHPVLQRIQVTGSGIDTKIEITADKPLTYTYYKMPDLLKVVIDLALVDPGLVTPITVNSELISKITVQKKSISDFFLTRVAINLEKDAEFRVSADPADKGKLRVSFGKTPLPADKINSDKSDADEAGKRGVAAAGDSAPQSPSTIAPPPVAVAVTAPAAESPATIEPAPEREQESVGIKAATDKSTAETETQTGEASALQREEAPVIGSSPALQPVVPQKIPAGSIRAIKIKGDGLEIVSESRVDAYKAFTLTKPGRLVIDVPLAKCAIPTRDIPVRRFGVARVRVGAYADKVRLVFDTEGKPFPAYRIRKTGNGLKVTFPALKKG